VHGAHDFRHTLATWLEDAGIPAWVIDQVMGHEATSHGSQQRGSAMGATTGTPPGDGRPHRDSDRAAPHTGVEGR
jgi:Phage integrase family